MKGPLCFDIAEALVAVVLVVIPQVFHIGESTHEVKQAGVFVII